MQRLPAAVRPVGLLEAFDDAIHPVRRLQQLGQAYAADAWEHALELALSRAPDAVLAQGQRQRAALGHGVFDAL